MGNSCKVVISNDAIIDKDTSFNKDKKNVKSESIHKDSAIFKDKLSTDVESSKQASGSSLHISNFHNNARINTLNICQSQSNTNSNFSSKKLIKKNSNEDQTCKSLMEKTENKKSLQNPSEVIESILKEELKMNHFSNLDTNYLEKTGSCTLSNLPHNRKIVMSKTMNIETKRISLLNKAPSTINDFMNDYKTLNPLLNKERNMDYLQFYEIKGEINKDNLEKLYEVRHKFSKNKFIMKQISKRNMVFDSELKLLEETNILMELDHPNLLKLFDMFEDSDYYTLFFEYFEGSELNAYNNEEMNENLAAEIIRQVLTGIDSMHSRKIMHRDIKPENIYLENKNSRIKIKIIDFGSATFFDEKLSKHPEKKENDLPFFTSPEMFAQSYDEKCDIWSCGVLLYTLLCGHPPFEAKNSKEIMKSIMRDKLKFPNESWEGISTEAKNFAKKILKKNPEARPSIQELLNDPWIIRNSDQLRFDLAKNKNVHLQKQIRFKY